MKIAVFYHHIREAAKQAGMTEEQVLVQLRKAGVGYAEADFDDLVKNPEMIVRLNEAGLSVSSIYCFFDFALRKEEDRVWQLIKTAHQARCRQVMVIPGFYYSEEKEARREALDRMVHMTGAFCQLASANGLTVTMEDFDDSRSPIKNSRGLLYFAERIPELKITFDTGNFVFCGEDVLEAFERLKDKIVHVHCKDRRIEGFDADEGKMDERGHMMYASPVGSGFLPMEEIVRRLQAMGYDGIYTAEHFGSMKQLEYMFESVAWLKAHEI